MFGAAAGRQYNILTVQPAKYPSPTCGYYIICFKAHLSVEK